jgi:hypothetical protein
MCCEQANNQNNQPKAQDCEVSEWSEWSSCSKSCGCGKKKRTREVLQKAANGGKSCPALEETSKCNTKKCAVKKTEKYKCYRSCWSWWKSLQVDNADDCGRCKSCSWSSPAKCKKHFDISDSNDQNDSSDDSDSGKSSDSRKSSDSDDSSDNSPGRSPGLAPGLGAPAARVLENEAELPRIE